MFLSTALAAATLRGELWRALPIVLALAAVAGVLLLCAVVAKLVRRWHDGLDPGSLVADVGFEYHESQRVFVSRLDAWQSHFGYCTLYDEATPATGMIIDCEPVRFEYGGRRWMIELWKGQYGLACGGEIGVYSTDLPVLELPGERTLAFYDDTSTLLNMTFALKHNGKALFHRQQEHWWLTGFRVGTFAPPDELSMNVRIALLDEVMRDAFVAALTELGYDPARLVISGSSVSFVYDTPLSPQPVTRTALMSGLVLDNTRALCEAYQEATTGIKDVQQQLEALRVTKPGLYREAVKALRGRELYSAHKTIEKTLGGAR